jgi:hypothetical protein
MPLVSTIRVSGWDQAPISMAPSLSVPFAYANGTDSVFVVNYPTNEVLRSL